MEINTNLRVTFFVSFIYGLLTGALVFLIPLYILHVGLNVGEIGLILAVLPLVFLIVRTLFASIVDLLGYKLILSLTSLFMFLMLTTYYFAHTVVLFIIGRISEGLKEASYWASIRKVPLIYEKRDVDKEKTLQMIMGFDIAGIGLGRILAGLLVSFFAFENTFLVLFFFTFMLFTGERMYKEKTVKKRISANDVLSNIRKELETTKNDERFWDTSIVLVFLSVFDAAIISFILPVFMRQVLNFDYLVIGILMGFLLVASAIGNFLVTKMLSKKKALLYFTMIAAVGLLLLAFFTPSYLLPGIGLIGLGFGMARALCEYFIARDVEHDKRNATRIALLHAPPRIAESVSYALVGGLTLYFGYTTTFLFALLIIIMFSIVAYSLTKKHPHFLEDFTHVLSK